MIPLFHIDNYKIDTSKFSNLLHDDVVTELEENFASYVGAKYACSANSASSLLFLSLLKYNETIQIPSMIPIVVPNVIINTGNKIRFYDDTEWVGHMYHLHDNIYDSAQQVSRNQYKDLDRDDAIMIFSFYPTKPVAGCDGGMVVSNNKEAIDWYKMMTLNGTTFSENNWDRKHITPGFKMHCNSIQAFIANESLKKLDKKNERLEEIRDMYNNSLGYTNTSNHLYRVRVRSNKMFINTVGEYMSCGIHYEECHKKEFYGGSLPLPRTESESPKTLSIPFHDHLTNNQVKYIISKVRDYVIVG